MNRKRIALIALLLAALTALLLFSACSGDDPQTDDTDVSDTPTEAPTEPDSAPGAETEEPGTLPETTPETVTETPTEGETEMETTKEPRAIDGTFDDPTHLFGFTEAKNADFVSSDKQGTVSFNDDGTFTVTGKWKAGNDFCPLLTVSYQKLVESCVPGFKKDTDMPNQNGEKYPIVVFGVKIDPCVAGDAILSFMGGKRNGVEGSVGPIVQTKGTGDVEYLVYDLTRTDFTDTYCTRLKLVWAWGTGEESNLGGSMTVVSIDLYHSTEEVWADKGIEPQVREDRNGEKLGISADKMSELMDNFFMGNTVKNETVMFLDRGDTRSLLFRIDEVLSVTNYDGSVTYKEGVDYAVRDGALVALEGGSLPVITRERYYSHGQDNTLCTFDENGKSVPLYYGEGSAITQYQVCVTYTHSDAWQGFWPDCEQGVYTDIIGKLKNGEDITVLFYGDSCTYGAAGSYAYGYPPYQYSYAMLFTDALAELFDYRVHYVYTGKPDNCHVPSQDYVCGDRGTITFLNAAVGGWRSSDGALHVSDYILPLVEKYGLDLFVLDIGGNDSTDQPTSTRRHDEIILNRVLEAAPDISVIIMSTMVPNPEATNGWYNNEFMQEPQLMSCADHFRAKGLPCAACRLTSMNLSVLDYIPFRDITGNNVNHPNDFFDRIYAITLLQTMIGYENLD